jgi:hypothetical protein
MGSPEQPELAQELTNSFAATDPEIAKHFARMVFLSDHRAELSVPSSTRLRRSLQMQATTHRPLSVANTRR